MNIDIVTLFPDLYTPFLGTSLIKRAQDKGVLRCSTHSLFDFVAPKERIDSPTYGHAAGMLIKPEVVERALKQVDEGQKPSYKIFFSPSGEKMSQRLVRSVHDDLRRLGKDNITLFCARYEGVDARVQSYYADRVISLGDFVLMGGDIPAMAFIEAFARYIPTVIGSAESVERDSFSGVFVDHPEYTAPAIWNGYEVPEVIRSGNHIAISQWQRQQAAKETILYHFDWARSCPNITSSDADLCRSYIPPHYVVLMHDQVMIPNQLGELVEGTTSITSLDIHDIARSSATYGMRGYFLVTPLEDQQVLANTLLDFWKTDAGKEYNPHRYEALTTVSVQRSLELVIADIEHRHNQKPLLITTGARESHHEKIISYNDQRVIFSQEKPIIIILGTGRGLSHRLIQQADYHFIPIEGFTRFNHLSVRSAAAIIFDKWLGKNISFV